METAADFDCHKVSQNLRRALMAMKEAVDVQAGQKKGIKRKRVKLFSEQDSSVHVQLVLKKTPVGFPMKISRITLPHSCYPEKTTSVCLFTKDIDRKWDHDVDRDARHFKELLCFQKGVTNLDQIISLQQLRREYKTYEAKRKLCSAYDVFLVDKRVVSFVNRHLGKKFHVTRKIPIPVDITVGDVKNNIIRALSTTSLTVKETSSRCAIKIGRLSQPVDDLVENFDAVCKAVEKHVPGGWLNVRTAYVENDGNEDMLKMPIFVSFSSSNLVNLDPPKKKVKEPVVGELSTLEEEEFGDCKVKVYPNGNVTLIYKDGREVELDDDEYGTGIRTTKIPIGNKSRIITQKVKLKGKLKVERQLKEKRKKLKVKTETEIKKQPIVMTVV